VEYIPSEGNSNDTKIKLENYATTSRYGFDYDEDRIVCVLIVYLDSSKIETIIKACNINKPIAIFTKLCNYDKIFNEIIKTEYNHKYKHTLIHVNSNTMLHSKDVAYCWMLYDFISPASELIAITPTHYMLSMNSDNKQKRKNRTPIFQIYTNERIVKIQSEVEIYQVRALAIHIQTEMQADEKKKNQIKSIVHKEQDILEEYEYNHVVWSIINDQVKDEKDIIQKMKYLYNNFKSHNITNDICTNCAHNLLHNKKTAKNNNLVGDIIEKLLEIAEKPSDNFKRYTIGFDANLMQFLRRILGYQLFNFLVRRFVLKYKK
jgi:hypothetical protein